MVKEFLQNLAFVSVFGVFGVLFGGGVVLIVLALWENLGWPVPAFFVVCALVAAGITWKDHSK